MPPSKAPAFAPRVPATRPRLVLRAAGLNDLPTLVDHRLRMWQDMGGRTAAALRRHTYAYRRWAAPLLASGRMRGFLVETRDGRAAGSGCVWFREAQPRPGEAGRVEPYILSMYTAPEFRGRGVATRIVRKILALSRARGCARVVLHGSVFGRSVYARLGFERTWEMRLFLDPSLARREGSTARSEAPPTAPSGPGGAATTDRHARVDRGAPSLRSPGRPRRR